ncbi:MAG: aminopeptidase P family protein [Elusimicrobiota bacterium]
MSNRIKDLQNILKLEKLDAVVSTRVLENGFLTGLHLDGYFLLVSTNDVWAFLPKMLLEHFKSKVNSVHALSPDNLLDGVISKMKEKKFKRVGFEPETETYLRGNFWKKNRLMEKKGLTTKLRMIKKGQELGTLKKSCCIAARAFEVIKSRIKPHRTEISVARELEDIMQSIGAKGPSFDIIVGSGPNSALPHHVTSKRQIKNNEVVLIDFGCVLDFYHSDMTRTIFLGKPNPEYKKVYQIVEQAQEKAISKIKDGSKARDIDKTAREHISDNGYGQYYVHGTGHGIGLEIHEAPTLNTKSQEVLKQGMTLTVEPGIYLPGKFGVRIEDSVLVTKTGSEILTK